MKLCVKGPSGLFHALDISPDVTVGELKEELAIVEEIPAPLLGIRFAGQELHSSVPIGEYEILEYSLQEEVLLHIERKTAEPTTIHIKAPSNTSKLITEVVEETATVEDVMGMMQTLEVVAAWTEVADVIVKRKTGTSIQNLGITRDHTMREARGIISNAQNLEVKSMIFEQSSDGHLYIWVDPSPEPPDVQNGETLTYSLRKWQPRMQRKPWVKDAAAVAADRKQSWDEELALTRKAAFERRLARVQKKVLEILEREGQKLEHVDIDLTQRRFNLKKEIEFEGGKAIFVHPKQAHTVLDQVAAALVTCNRVLAQQRLQPNQPLSVSVEGHTAGPAQELSDLRAQVCMERLIQSVCEKEPGSRPEQVKALFTSVGHSDRVLNMRAVVMRVIVPGDTASSSSIDAAPAATEQGLEGPEAAPLSKPESDGEAQVEREASGDPQRPLVAAGTKSAGAWSQMYRQLAKEWCLMDRSTDYDPYHTWLPPALRRQSPWPLTGPPKPSP